MSEIKVQLIAHTPQPEKIVAAAAKLCYSNAEIDDLMDGLTEEKSREFVTMLAGLGHASPMEHASFTFAIEGVSRAFLAQATRHRIASFSVQSQRYVQLDNFDYVLPPEIAGDEETEEIYKEAMRQEAEIYEKLAASLQQKHTKDFMAQGMPEKEAKRKAQKKAIEDARFALPNACTTKMIMTMNARSLMNFFALRCCNRAQWEIQAVADEMLKLVYPVAPALFAKAGAPCVGGACPEGKMTCGKAAEVRQKYEKIKAGVQNG